MTGRTSTVAAMAAAWALIATVVWPPAPARAHREHVCAGSPIYARECAHCHGLGGRGDGPAAAMLDPRPRDFTRGLYKLRSTESGELPTDDDLLRTVTEGIPATGMPSFRHLGEHNLRAVIEHIKKMGGPEGERGSWFDIYEVPPAVEVPPRPPVTEESRRLGALLYTKMGCDGCHGKTGRGDGKKPEELIDDWGRPLRARNFHLGVFKGGSGPDDIYKRVMTGMDGTPMTGFWKDVMTPAERWALVEHLLSLAEPTAVEQPAKATLRAAGGLVKDDGSRQVSPESLPRMALRGGWLRRFLPLTVSAVAESSTGERRLGLSVAWDDDEAGCQKLEAVFPTRSPAPSFHLGSEAEPVEIWTWSRAAGASVYTATGFNSRKQLAKRPEATARVSTTRHSVELTATPPAGTSQVLFLVSGCIDGENYLSATTYADIEWPQALAAKGGNP